MSGLLRAALLQAVTSQVGRSPAVLTTQRKLLLKKLCRMIEMIGGKQPAGQAKPAIISAFLQVKPLGTGELTPGPYD